MKQKILLAIFFVSCLTMCYGQNTDKTKTVGSSKANTSVIPTDSKQAYFPFEVDSDVNIWYSKHLFAMKEPVIYMDKSHNEIYRFTWLRTFHNPVSIRIEKYGGVYVLFWKLCSGAGGYEPGDLTINKYKKIDKVQWDEFKKYLNQIGFWNVETKGREPSGFDGSRWILEGKRQNKYHFVDRWTPKVESTYYQCCNFLIGLTDLVIKSDEKY